MLSFIAVVGLVVVVVVVVVEVSSRMVNNSSCNSRGRPSISCCQDANMDSIWNPNYDMGTVGLKSHDYVPHLMSKAGGESA